MDFNKEIAFYIPFFYTGDSKKGGLILDSLWFWVGFHLFVLSMIYVDLKVFHKRPLELTVRDLCLCCLFWVGLAIAFNLFIWKFLGLEPALTFLTAYLLESSLSIDNLFVFLVVFSFCQIKTVYQHRVLYWGILGALLFRISFILLGIALLQKFEWMYFLFGAFLCFSALMFFRQKEEQKDMGRSFLVKIAKKLFRFDHGEHQGRFFILKEGKYYATMLFLALFLIEVSDVIFAVDSVPAVLAVTSNVVIAYTSNVFAVLGLRSFYFLLAKLKSRFRHLKNGIALILFFVGAKLILLPFWKIPALITLLVIAVALSVSIALSFRSVKKM